LLRNVQKEKKFFYHLFVLFILPIARLLPPSVLRLAAAPSCHTATLQPTADKAASHGLPLSLAAASHHNPPPINLGALHWSSSNLAPVKIPQIQSSYGKALPDGQSNH